MSNRRVLQANEISLPRLRAQSINLTKKEVREWALFLEEDEDAVQLLFNVFNDPDYIDEDAIAKTTANLRGPSTVKKEYLEEQEKINYAAIKSQLILEINRAAFEQTDVDLISVLTTDDMKTMVAVLTDTPRFKVRRLENRITVTMTRLLLKCIRPSVRKTFLENPKAFTSHTGFLYTASDEYGNGTTHWCQLAIPNLFKPGEEIELLNTLRDNSAFAARQMALVDNAILSYREAKASLIEQEIRFATKLQNNLQDKTWLGLLKRWPTWFVGLYENKFKKTLFEHTYDDQTYFRSLGIRYRYTDAKCGLYEQYLQAT